MATNIGNGQTRLRLLFPIPTLGKGGAERFLLDLCHALKKRGDVDLMIATLGNENRYPELSEGLPLVDLDYEPFSWRRPRANQRWAQLLDDFRPNVVHSHLFLAEFLTAESIRSNVAYVCHGHDNMPQFEPASLRTFTNRQLFLRWTERRRLFARKYQRVRTVFVANSAHTLNFYQRVLPSRMRDDVRLIHVGFDAARFRTAPRKVGRDSPLRLINVGSFVEKKNQQLIVAIGQGLAARKIPFRIDLLGDGPDRARLETQTAALGLRDQILFHGNVDHVETFLRESDLYVHAARYEPFGLAILEAMAAGLPCIVRDGLGDRDVIVEGENGFLLDHENVDKYVDCILSLMADPARYSRMSEFATVFSERFDIDRTAERFVELYDDLVGSHDSRTRRWS